MSPKHGLILLACACGPSAGPSQETDDATTQGTTTAQEVTIGEVTTSLETAAPTSGDVVVGCGDGVRDEGEECDDGNLGGGDGCESDCRWTRRELWYLHIDDGGHFGAPACYGDPRQLAVTPELVAIQVGCLGDATARQAAATPDGQLAGRTTWDGRARWVAASGADTVYVAGDGDPLIRTVTGALVKALEIPARVGATETWVTGLFPWPGHGVAVSVSDDLSEDNQRILLYEEDAVARELEVKHSQDTIELPDIVAAADESGRIWGSNSQRAGFFRLDATGVVDLVIGETERPQWFQLAPNDAFVGARGATDVANTCSPWHAARVWRWSAGGAPLWTAKDCEGDALAALGRIQLGLLAVDHAGDVLIAGQVLSADGTTTAGATVLKLDGLTGAQKWQTIVDPGPGYVATTIDALQIGVDDSIFLAGREAATAATQDGWLRRLSP
ncbi:hypothetical protein [Nannocystis punicea]|uniref:Myxococcus cysteine-rich repeat-containing protein n=1 Tax=Nannocystis punicea TaxID=2995304 RepID=A0ABY7GY44_9BACT|nr:hypothetical protein [Nannocystis poenicansa]WAS91805.1 hypothetical protein O0S08_36950 [Nannocystis poenicansa]